jgi:hypothetical protein
MTPDDELNCIRGNKIKPFTPGCVAIAHIASCCSPPEEMISIPLKGEKRCVGHVVGEKSHRRSLVGFSESVSVFFIPRRCDYPEDLKRTIFPSRKELSINAARNMMEFASDGCDWRKAKEDHEMYINANGERVHPIHLTQIWSSRQEIPAPSQDLPKPKPQRPVHPSFLEGRHLFASHRRGSSEPVIRPPTPSPFVMETIVG